MKIDYDNIHRFILRKCTGLPIIKKEINKNGVIMIDDDKLDFFSFIARTVISQQISNTVANQIWGKLCSYINKKTLSIRDFKNKAFLENSLKHLKISKQKRSYIANIFDAISTKEIITENLRYMHEEDFKSLMMKYKGIGEWTCNMALIFYFKNLNIFPEQDLVLKKMEQKLNTLEMRKINFKNEFKPFLSILSLHLWKMSKRIL